ncbi:MAG: hypothetical protein ABL929_07145, partial [Ferruginibacter sp.]
FTYSLLPNHFHIVLRIKDYHNITSHFEETKKKKFDPIKFDISDFIMERFSNFLNSYTKAINKTYNRKGALFLDYLKRSKVKNESDFTSFIFYVHKNAVHHGYCKEIGDWPHDAYNSFLSKMPTKLLRDEVIIWFGGVENFKQFHNQPIDLKKVDFHEFD